MSSDFTTFSGNQFKKSPIGKRFWSKVKISNKDQCWHWLSNKDKDGYGRFRMPDLNYMAHRMAWILSNGPIPDGQFVLHRCDNNDCVNPKHLYLGNQKDSRRWKNKLPIADRFWNKVNINNDDDCWPWIASKDAKGYGFFKLDGKMVHAHRMALVLEGEKVPDKLLVCHKCDNPPCCNPRHLFIGTHKDNTQDSVRKGRWPIGEKHHNSKLTEKDIIKIRKLHSKENLSMYRIAKMFNVSNVLIGLIIKRKIWRHV